MKALLYDMGGVLLGTDPEPVLDYWARAGGEPVEKLRRRWRITQAYRRFETGEIDFPALSAALGRQLGVAMSEDDWLTGWNLLLGGLIEGVLERAERVAALLPQCIYTNTNPAHEARWRELFGDRLAPFRHIYVSSTIGRRKPDPDSFRFVAADMGYACEDIVLLDDSADNVAGAREAGMRTVHVTTPAVAEAFLDRLLATA